MLTDYLMLAQGWNGDRNQLKSALIGFLGPRQPNKDGSPSWQFSPDPESDPDSGLIRLRLCGISMPERMRAHCAPVELPEIQIGDRVQVSFWSGFRKRNLSGRAVAPGDLVKRYGPRFEKATHIEKILAGDIQTSLVHSRARERFPLVFARLSISGVVEDIRELKDILRRGVGTGQVYGLGLVDLQKLHQEN